MATSSPPELLLDTHALLWWFFEPAALSKRSREAIEARDTHVWVSAASAWEIAIKHTQGKLPLAAPLISAWPELLAGQGFQELAISARLGLLAGSLPRHHGDPFDRMLIAQALTDRLGIVSKDRQFDAYGVQRVW